MIRGAVYFVLVFSVGFLLGVARVLFLEPSLGVRWAELAEMPVMVIAIVLAARFVLRRFPAPRRASYLFSGGVALLLLVLVEFSVVLGIRGLSVGQYFAERDPVAGTVYALMLMVFEVLLSNHTDYDGTKQKLPALASRAAGAPHPYVVGNESVRRYLTVAHECAQAALANTR